MAQHDSAYLYPDLKWGIRRLEDLERCDGYELSSFYIPMGDGVKIAADLYLPRNLAAGMKIPAMLYRTRYWRREEMISPEEQEDPVIGRITRYGYAVLRVDVRGTGASFGHVRMEWQEEDTEDARRLLDWITRQPWSNGRVGSFGGSYAGNTAVLLGETGHPASLGIWATCFEFDGFGDILFPGGVPTALPEMWGEYTRMLDKNLALDDDGNPHPQVRGVMPVDEDVNRTLLEQAVTEHEKNNNVADILKKVVFRDDEVLPGATLEHICLYNRREKIFSSGVPMDIWGSWMDANTADTVIRFFVNNPGVRRGVISPWNHGGGLFCSPFVAPGAEHEMPFETLQVNEIIRFMESCDEARVRSPIERGIYYYTLGEETWKFTPTWPPAGFAAKELYFRASGTLAEDRPGGGEGPTEYTVNFEASTGMENRWMTELTAGPVAYPDRKEQDALLTVFETEPISGDLEVTGHPEITLFVSSTAGDGAFFAYLEDVDENGKVTYVTEGMLRALHRRVDPDGPGYTQFSVYHSLRRGDAEPLVPGEITEIRFSLFPVSVLFRSGHRIRLALGGADASFFRRVPEEGDPVLTIFHDAEYPSKILLPAKTK